METFVDQDNPDLIVLCLCKSARQLTIDLSPVPDSQNQDDHFLVLNTGNDSEISDPVFPEFTQLGAFKGLTNAAGVFQADDPLL